MGKDLFVGCYSCKTSCCTHDHIRHTISVRTLCPTVYYEGLMHCPLELASLGFHKASMSWFLYRCSPGLYVVPPFPKPNSADAKKASNATPCWVGSGAKRKQWSDHNRENKQ